MFTKFSSILQFFAILQFCRCPPQELIPKGNRVENARVGSFPSLCLYAEYSDNTLLGTGIILNTLWSVGSFETIGHVDNASTIYLTAGNVINFEDLTKDKGVGRHRIVELKSVDEVSFLILAKLENPLLFSIDVGPGFVNSAVFHDVYYKCKMVIWALEDSFDIVSGEVPEGEENLFKKTISGITYSRNAISKCGGIKELCCLDFSEALKINNFHFGAPVLCGVGIEGAFIGVKGEDTEVSSDVYNALRLRDLPSLQKIISEPTLQVAKLQECLDRHARVFD